MTCKYCGKEDAQWPENYVKGCKMIETETGIIHTRKRCEEIQNPHKKPVVSKGGLMTKREIENFFEPRKI